MDSIWNSVASWFRFSKTANDKKNDGSFESNEVNVARVTVPQHDMYAENDNCEIRNFTVNAEEMCKQNDVVTFSESDRGQITSQVNEEANKTKCNEHADMSMRDRDSVFTAKDIQYVACPEQNHFQRQTHGSQFDIQHDTHFTNDTRNNHTSSATHTMHNSVRFNDEQQLYGTCHNTYAGTAQYEPRMGIYVPDYHSTPFNKNKQRTLMQCSPGRNEHFSLQPQSMHSSTTSDTPLSFDVGNPVNPCSDKMGGFNENTEVVTTKSKSHRKHKEPIRFNGKADWNDYYSHFLAVSEWNEWSYRECGLQLALSLVDEAREIFSGLPRDQRQDFNALTRALKQRYDPEGRETSYSFELMNRTKKSNEDSTTFGYALRKLAGKAYPHMQLPEQVLVNLYINGLGDKELKRHVYLSKPDTLDEAIKTASTFEGFDEPKRPFNAGEKTRKPKIGEVNAVKNDSANLKPMKPESSSVGGEIQNCLKEIKSGLDKMDQRLSCLEQTPRPNNYQRQQHQTRTVECFKCKGPHYQRDCPQLLQNNQRRSFGNRTNNQNAVNHNGGQMQNLN